MKTFKIGDEVYCFLGERLERFTVNEIVDDLRVAGENADCTFCVYQAHCYESAELAVNGMLRAVAGMDV